MYFFSTSSLILLIIMVLTMIFFTMQEKLQMMKWEKFNSFECGFNILSFKNPSFSMNFFLLTIMFLMFDIEISIILPSIFMNNSNMLIKSLMFLFTIALLIFLLEEWNQGMMEWVK